MVNGGANKLLYRLLLILSFIDNTFFFNIFKILRINRLIGKITTRHYKLKCLNVSKTMGI